MYNPSDPTIPRLGIYPLNTLWKDSLKKLLIPALFVKNQCWKTTWLSLHRGPVWVMRAIQWNRMILGSKNEVVPHAQIWKNPQDVLWVKNKTIYNVNMLYLSLKGERKSHTHVFVVFKKTNREPQFLEDGVPVSKAPNSLVLLLLLWSLLLGRAISVMMLIHFFKYLVLIARQASNLSPLIFLSTSQQHCQKMIFSPFPKWENRWRDDKEVSQGPTAEKGQR